MCKRAENSWGTSSKNAEEAKGPERQEFGPVLADFRGFFPVFFGCLVGHPDTWKSANLEILGFSCVLQPGS